VTVTRDEAADVTATPGVFPVHVVPSQSEHEGLVADPFGQTGIVAWAVEPQSVSVTTVIVEGKPVQSVGAVAE
jgi:hypothetical protein